VSADSYRLTCTFSAIWISEQQFNSWINADDLSWIRKKNILENPSTDVHTKKCCCKITSITTRIGANMFVTLLLWKNVEQVYEYGLTIAVNNNNYERRTFKSMGEKVGRKTKIVQKLPAQGR